MTPEEIESTRQRYIDLLQPVFLPPDPVGHDIVNYFASLLRVVGTEDNGWDPYLESRATLENLNAILGMELPTEKFPDSNLTMWRMGLLMYGHIVEMDAPYEVLTNLLRFRLGKGYHPNPYVLFMTREKGARKRRRIIYPTEKIRIIKTVAKEAGVSVGDIFDDFYRNELRNAIFHSDFILTQEEFRCRGGTGGMHAFSLPLQELNRIITCAKIFISTFFGVEAATRRHWGQYRHRAIPYDPTYKGLMEVLTDDKGLLCGFKVHWPNKSESLYRRTDAGIDMVNCMLNLKNATLDLMVGLYAREPGTFSPLVEKDQMPKYTSLEGSGALPVWTELVTASQSTSGRSVCATEKRNR